jgi:hypothetical protein
MPMTPSVIRSEGAARPAAARAAAGTNQGIAAAAPAAIEPRNTSRRVILSIGFIIICLLFWKLPGLRILERPHRPRETVEKVPCYRNK